MQLLPQDCRARARRKGVFFSQTPVCKALLVFKRTCLRGSAERNMCRKPYWFRSSTKCVYMYIYIYIYRERDTCIHIMIVESSRETVSTQLSAVGRSIETGMFTLCVCICVYIHTYMYMHMYIHTHTYTLHITHMHNLCVHLYISLSIHIYIYIYICIYVYIYICICTRTHTGIVYTHTYVCIHEFSYYIIM